MLGLHSPHCSEEDKELVLQAAFNCRNHNEMNDLLDTVLRLPSRIEYLDTMNLNMD